MAKDRYDLRNNESPFNDDDTDYKALIDSAASRGDMEAAAQYETWRNNKLDNLGRSDEKTYSYTNANGSYLQNETASTQEEISPAKNSSASAGTDSSSANKSTSSGGWASKLSQYGSSIDDLYNSIANRDAFSYDTATDPLYQQYADQYTALGNQAMQDTLGQVSARTGGLASSYATGASQGAYNSYMQQLASKIPELYQLAYSMYQDEGDRQYQNLDALRGIQSDERSWDSENWNRNFQTKQYESDQAQQTQENTWYEEQVARGINEKALQAAMSNSLPQEQWEAQKEQYRKTGKGGAAVANYETYFDYMTGLTNYYATQLR